MTKLAFLSMFFIMMIQVIVIPITLYRTHSKETKMLLTFLQCQGIVLTYLLTQMGSLILNGK